MRKGLLAAFLSLYFLLGAFMAIGRAILSAAGQAGDMGTVAEFWNRLRGAGGVGFGTAIVILVAIGALAIAWDSVWKQKRENKRTSVLDHRGVPFEWSKRLSVRSAALWASLGLPPVLLIVVLIVAVARGGVPEYSTDHPNIDGLSLGSQSQPESATPIEPPPPPPADTGNEPEPAPRHRQRKPSPQRSSDNSQRDPNAFYQFGDIVAEVNGASIDRSRSRITFFSIVPTVNSKMNASKTVEYQKYVLRCHDDKGGDLPVKPLPPNQFAGVRISPPAFGFSCDIVGLR